MEYMDNLPGSTDKYFDYGEQFSVDKRLLKKRYRKLLKKKYLSQDEQEELVLCDFLIMALKGKPTGALIRFDDKGLYVTW